MLGFHGCDETIRNKLVLDPNAITKSEERYNWLGHGFYIWENNYDRALSWAKEKQKRAKIETPSVLVLKFNKPGYLDRFLIALSSVINVSASLLE
jgi:hypothetical protein